MEETWRPTAAGILTIIAGVALLIIGLVIVGFGALIPFGFMLWFGGLLGMVGAPFIILGIIAIVGGIYALKRRIWGLALVGSICALPAGFLLGLLAIIFVSLGKGEFK
jgi:hypothetical protein